MPNLHNSLFSSTILPSIFKQHQITMQNINQFICVIFCLVSVTASCNTCCTGCCPDGYYCCSSFAPDVCSGGACGCTAGINPSGGGYGLCCPIPPTVASTTITTTTTTTTTTRSLTDRCADGCHGDYYCILACAGIL